MKDMETKLKELQSMKDKALGVIEQVRKELKEKFGCETIKEAIKLRYEKSSQLEKEKAQLEKRYKELQQQYPDLFKDD